MTAAALAVAACGGSARSSPAPVPSGSPSRLPRSTTSHVVVVVMENKEYGSVIASRSAPYENGLARRYALLTRFYGVAHPSLPNYIALVAGSTLGIHSD